MEDSVEKKRKVWQWIVCIGLVCLIWGGYFFGKYRIQDIKYRQISLFEDDFSWVYQVDTIIQEEKNVVLQGFAFELGKDATEGTYEIILRDIESEENYFMKMEYMKRADVNSYFMCEDNYLLSGFNASIKSKQIDLEKKKYEVLLRVLGEKTAYRTGTYISNGEIEYVNPLEYKPLDVAGTELEKIVEEGYLRVYRPDHGIYVYQYEGELYWIAESTSDFLKNEMYVQYQFDTIHIVDAIQNLSDVQQYAKNVSFMFAENEVTEWSTGKYRVTKKEVPKGYSIRKMWTGEYIEEWIWQQYFRPHYQFD